MEGYYDLANTAQDIDNVLIDAVNVMKSEVSNFGAYGVPLVLTEAPSGGRQHLELSSFLIWKGNETQFNAIQEKDQNTLYLVWEDDE